VFACVACQFQIRNRGKRGLPECGDLVWAYMESAAPVPWVRRRSAGGRGSRRPVVQENVKLEAR